MAHDEQLLHVLPIQIGIGKTCRNRRMYKSKELRRSRLCSQFLTVTRLVHEFNDKSVFVRGLRKTLTAFWPATGDKHLRLSAAGGVSACPQRLRPRREARELTEIRLLKLA